ncbi:MAG TPA: CDP-diacylglycerol--serine O-phosphatidyltransferase [Cyclobacteriaceae bacterium]|nr:CDP-diacylglycerol--serine O-phosphatidyltransferase [Cyclobacteriaceae bacterium]
MSLLKHLPNALTVCNLLCGCLGIISANERGADTMVPLWIIAACVFDFLDGFAARLLKVSSPIGKELDSLADMVTFGALPAVYMFYHVQLRNLDFIDSWLAFAAFLLAACSAIRLAKFNVDTRQTDGFIGVPTPANALFISTLPQALDYFHVPIPIEWYPLTLILIILLFSWLMVSPLRLFALKFKTFGWKGNELKFTFLLVSGLLIVVFKVAAVPVIIILYILVSLFSGGLRTGKEPTN